MAGIFEAGTVKGGLVDGGRDQPPKRTRLHRFHRLRDGAHHHRCGVGIRNCRRIGDIARHGNHGERPAEGFAHRIGGYGLDSDVEAQPRGPHREKIRMPINRENRQSKGLPVGIKLENEVRADASRLAHCHCKRTQGSSGG